MSDLIDLTALQCYYESLEMLQEVLQEGGGGRGGGGGGGGASALAGGGPHSHGANSKQLAHAQPSIRTVTASAVVAWYSFCTAVAERLAEAAEEERRQRRMARTPAAGRGSESPSSSQLAQSGAALLPQTNASPFCTRSQLVALDSLVAMRDRWTAALAHLLVLPPVADGASWFAHLPGGAGGEGVGGGAEEPPSLSEMGLAMRLAAAASLESTSYSCPSSPSAVGASAAPSPPLASRPGGLSFAVHSPLPTRLFAISVMLSTPPLAAALAPFVLLPEALAATERLVLHAAGGDQRRECLLAGTGWGVACAPASGEEARAEEGVMASAGGATAKSERGPSALLGAGAVEVTQLCASLPFAAPSPLRRAAVAIFTAVAEARTLALAETYKVPAAVFDSFTAVEYILTALTLDVDKLIKIKRPGPQSMEGGDDSCSSSSGDDCDSPSDLLSDGSDGAAAAFAFAAVPLPTGPPSSSAAGPSEADGFGRQLTFAALPPGIAAERLPPILRPREAGAAQSVCAPLAPLLEALRQQRSGDFTAGACRPRRGRGWGSGTVPVPLRLPPFLSVDGRKITAAFGTVLLQSEHYAFVGVPPPSLGQEAGPEESGEGKGANAAPPAAAAAALVAAFASSPDDRRWLESAYGHAAAHLAGFAFHIGERYSPPAIAGMLPVVNDLLRGASLLGARADMILLTASVENYGSIGAAKARLQALALMQHTTAAAALARQHRSRAVAYAAGGGGSGGASGVTSGAQAALTNPQPRLQPNTARGGGGGGVPPTSPAALPPPSASAGVTSGARAVVSVAVRRGDLVRVALRSSPSASASPSAVGATSTDEFVLGVGADAEVDAALAATCAELSPTDPASTHLVLRHHPARDVSLKLMLFTALAYKRLLAEVRGAVAKAVATVYDDEEVMAGVFKTAAARAEAAAKREKQTNTDSKGDGKRKEKKEKKEKKSRNKDGAACESTTTGAPSSAAVAESAPIATNPDLLEASPFAIGLLANLIHPLVCVASALPDIAYSDVASGGSGGVNRGGHHSSPQHPTSLAQNQSSKGGTPSPSPSSTCTAPNAGTHVVRYAFHEVMSSLEQQHYSRVLSSSAAASSSSSARQRWVAVLSADRRSFLRYAAVCPLLDSLGDPFLRSQLLGM